MSYVVLRSRDALALAMSAAGVSVRALAADTGLNRSVIGHLRSGRVEGASAETAEAICERLGVELGVVWRLRNEDVARKLLQ